MTSEWGERKECERNNRPQECHDSSLNHGSITFLKPTTKVPACFVVYTELCDTFTLRSNQAISHAQQRHSREASSLEKDDEFAREKL